MRNEVTPRDSRFGGKRLSGAWATAMNLAALVFLQIHPAGAEPAPALQLESPAIEASDLREVAGSPVWEDGVGEGFRSGAEYFNISVGASVGVPILGGQQHHDLSLASLSYGRVLGSLIGAPHWYRGNFEGRLELFAGGQFLPNARPFVGLTPHLRYDVSTGTRWVPFIDAGAGVTASGVGPPDQSGTFEFNLQGCIGTSYFLRPNLALTVDARLLHMSCAGLHSPNLGLNTILGTIGLSWYF